MDFVLSVDDAVTFDINGVKVWTHTLHLVFDFSPGCSGGRRMCPVTMRRPVGIRV